MTESCDVYAVLVRLQLYHKEVQGPSSTGSLPLTQWTLVIVCTFGSVYTCISEH